MSIPTAPVTSIPGCVHVRLRLKGSARNIEIFHAGMFLAESSWPWVNHRHGTSVCKSCSGISLNLSRVNAEDIKAFSKQCNIRCSVLHFAPESSCRERGAVSVSYMTFDKMHTLYEWKPGKGTPMVLQRKPAGYPPTPSYSQISNPASRSGVEIQTVSTAPKDSVADKPTTLELVRAPERPPLRMFGMGYPIPPEAQHFTPLRPPLGRPSIVDLAGYETNPMKCKCWCHTENTHGAHKFTLACCPGAKIDPQFESSKVFPLELLEKYQLDLIYDHKLGQPTVPHTIPRFGPSRMESKIEPETGDMVISLVRVPGTPNTYAASDAAEDSDADEAIVTPTLPDATGDSNAPVEPTQEELIQTTLEAGGAEWPPYGFVM